MAKSSSKVNVETLETQVAEMVQDAKKGLFRPVYLLMGDEPYYIDKVCDAIIDNALDESERDFNQVICYGSDVDADKIVTYAMRYPMMAARQLVVVKEAQLVDKIDESLAAYCANPVDTTILVLCMKGKSADKRRAFYKNVLKKGQILESNKVKDYEMAQWIVSYFKGKGLNISHDAAAFFADAVGTDMIKVHIETEKMFKNLPTGTVDVTVEDVEKNIGISREFTIFELLKALDYGSSPKAMRLAQLIGGSHGFAMPMATAALAQHYVNVLKYGAVMSSPYRMDSKKKAWALPGVNPFFYKDYDSAIRLYPPRNCMSVISLLRDFDYRGKGGDGEAATQEELLVELTSRIISCSTAR